MPDVLYCSVFILNPEYLAERVERVFRRVPRQKRRTQMKILFNPPLALLVVGFFYVVGFVAHGLNQMKAALPKRSSTRVR